MLLFTALCTVFLNETFGNLDGGSVKHLSPKVGTCSASHPDLVRHCLKLADPQETADFAIPVNEAKASPLFMAFTTKSVPNSQAAVHLSLRAGTTTVYSISVQFSQDVEFSFNVGTTKASSGVLEYEKILTHSIAVAIEDNSFKVYIDGYVLGVGAIAQAQPSKAIDSVSVTLKNGNATLEFGNLVVGDDPKVRWDHMISCLLRYRSIERAAVRREMVDAEEERLFGRKLKGKVDWLAEEGTLLDYEECDPRRFRFPFGASDGDNDEEEKAPGPEDVVERDIEDYEMDEMDEMGEEESEL